LLEAAGEVLSLIRKAKTGAQVSMRAEVAAVTITAGPDRRSMVETVENDIRSAGVVLAPLFYRDGDDLGVEVTLAPVTA
jgi:valyl-tRNA synthetase